MTIETLIASRLLALRRHKALSLAALAEVSGVSRAMISKIERGDSSPSATILGRLAAGLGVSLAQLLVEEEPGPARRLRRRAEQALWRDPEAGYLRRQVNERDPATGVELVEVELPPSARIAYPPWQGKPYRQRLWLLAGVLGVDYGSESYRLEIGDCLDFCVDRPLTFTAMEAAACRYLLVMSAD
ncbi:XRE family transcriptional regulator [Paludibacterium yongneupense]|uniref:XRE family transcriptional regulator n=1 Tax=Paludibacterium yongneupense TaxID=400061 RepID=UPI000428C582|nr:XRE family transcriptional regulator [Paludibacterium yongneupense]